LGLEDSTIQDDAQTGGEAVGGEEFVDVGWGKEGEDCDEDVEMEGEGEGEDQERDTEGEGGPKDKHSSLGVIICRD